MKFSLFNLQIQRKAKQRFYKWFVNIREKSISIVLISIVIKVLILWHFNSNLMMSSMMIIMMCIVMSIMSFINMLIFMLCLHTMTMVMTKSKSINFIEKVTHSVWLSSNLLIQLSYLTSKLLNKKSSHYNFRKKNW